MFSDEIIFEKLKQTWQPVALSRELKLNAVINYTLLGENLVLVRFPDGILAAKDLCPHRGAKLSLGKVENNQIICPYHGWSFAQNGNCTLIPSLGAPPSSSKKGCLTTFQTAERYGMVWVKLNANGSSQIPEIPEFEDQNWTYLVAEPMKFNAGFRREIENYLDMSHFAFAHQDTLGIAAAREIDDISITKYADGLEMNAPFPSLSVGDETPGKLQQAHFRTQRVYLPNFTTIRQTFGDGDERVLVHIPSPNSQFQCTVFWALAISPNFNGPTPEDQMEFAVRVLEEDRFMVENQHPLEVPITPEKSTIVPADKFARQFKTAFIRFLQEIESNEEKFALI